MASQRFCLRWNNHQSNLLSVFDQLLHEEWFVDVTLAVEGQYLKAHKMVLSACSPYFQALFVDHPEKHPIVILKDVPYSDMKSLLDFMYRGEVSVDQDRLTAFLKVAESLRIKGLTEVNEERCDLPLIANSLLSQSGGPAGHSSTNSQGQQPASLPPPPPSLHRLPPPTRKHFLPFNPVLNSALSAPKRKRGRPRKLSGSNPGTPNPTSGGSEPDDETKLNNVDHQIGANEKSEQAVKAAPVQANPGQALVNHSPSDSPANPPAGAQQQSAPSSSGPQGGRDSPGAPSTDQEGPAEDSEEKDGKEKEPASGSGTVKEEMSGPDGDVDDDDEFEDSGPRPPSTPTEDGETSAKKEPTPGTSGQDNNGQYSGGGTPDGERFPSGTKRYPEDHPENLDYEEMIACSPGSSEADESFEYVEGEDHVLEAEYADEDISQMEQESLQSLFHSHNPTPMATPARQQIPVMPPSDDKKRIDKMSIRKFCTREGNTYRCSVCSKTYTHVSNFCRHFLSSHYGVRQEIQCPVCRKPFTRKDNMMTHAKQVHGKAFMKGVEVTDQNHEYSST